MSEELFKEKVLNVHIEEELKKSYLDYSMSVIIGRALPDVRDGLKPVHRRIIFAMNDLGCLPNRPYKKSARIVGEVLGKYHPHGESSVYDALVRMAQPFSLRYPLVDGHGNFGSIDGDVPAAMRYTEARLAPVTMEMLAGLDKNTVDYIPNFDNTLQEPVVLPAKFPNLLINGSSGIAVGMATNIPPHNLREVVDALLYIIDKEILGKTPVNIEEFYPLIKGPDFPTGGYIVGKDGIKEYFLTGRGSITIRGKWHLEEVKHKKNTFVITEIPYEVNKSQLVEKIALLAKEKKIKGVEDIRDESDRDGIRIVVKLTSDTDPKFFEMQLRAHTQFEVKYGVIMLGILHNVPNVFSIKELLTEFLNFRSDVLRKETIFDLDKAEHHLEILEGLKRAILKIDEVVALIKQSKDTADATERIMSLLQVNETQCKAILDMRLSRLTSLEISKLESDMQETRYEIEKFKNILEDEKVFWEVIKEDLRKISRNYGNERKTEIVEEGPKLSMDALIEDTENIIIITRDGYIKRMPLETFRTQRRGGQGVLGSLTSEEDYPKEIITTTAKSKVLFFTNKGKAYALIAYEVPEADRSAKGTPIHRLLRLSEDEYISSALSITRDSKPHSILFVTKRGKIKRTRMEEFERFTSVGKIAITIPENDELVVTLDVEESNEVLITSSKGQAVRFGVNEIRLSGRSSMGVIGCRVRENDRVVDAELVDQKDLVILITSRGYGKKIKVNEIRKVKRGAKGVRCLKVDKKSGDLEAVRVLKEEKILFVITKNGKVVKMELKEIPLLSRNARGVRIVSFKEEDDTVSSIAVS